MTSRNRRRVLTACEAIHSVLRMFVWFMRFLQIFVWFMHFLFMNEYHLPIFSTVAKKARRQESYRMTAREPWYLNVGEEYRRVCWLSRRCSHDHRPRMHVHTHTNARTHIRTHAHTHTDARAPACTIFYYALSCAHALKHSYPNNDDKAKKEKQNSLA